MNAAELVNTEFSEEDAAMINSTRVRVEETVPDTHLAQVSPKIKEMKS